MKGREGMKRILTFSLVIMLLIGIVMLFASCGIFSLGGAPGSGTEPGGGTGTEPGTEPGTGTEPGAGTEPEPDPEPTLEYVTVKLLESASEKLVGEVRVVKGETPTAENVAAITGAVYHGYTFKSWHYIRDAGEENRFDATKVIDTDITLYGDRSNLAGKNITWSYEADTKTLTFIGTGKMFDFQYNSDPLWIQYAELCENVIIDSGITSIGNHAFYKFSKLSYVELPRGTVRIGERAFYDSSIVSINFPDTLERIEVGAFYKCQNLTELVFNRDLKYIGEQAFYQCSEVSRITLTDKIAEIGNSAFYECNNLKIAYYYGTREEYNNLVIRLDNFWMKELANTYFYTEAKPAAPGPYWYYTSDGEIAPWYYTVGFKAPETILPFAWDYVDPDIGVEQRNIDFMNNIVYHGYKFKSFTGHTYTVGTVLEGDIHLTGDRGDLCGESLTYTKTDTTLTINGNGAMWDFEDIYDAPWHSQDITTVIIGDGVTHIGKNAFCYLNKIVSIDIPTNVTSIHKNAFLGCTRLLYIYYEGSKSELDALIGTSPLENLLRAKIYTYYPEGSGEGTWWRRVTGSMESTERRVAWTLEGGKLTVGGDATLVNYGDISETPWYPDIDSITSLEIISGANRVGYNSFTGMTELTSISLPDTVRKIAYNAFSGTGYYNNTDNWTDGSLYISGHLIKVKSETAGEIYEIREGTVSIAENAFEGCASIKKLVFSKDVKGVYRAALEPLELDAIYFMGISQQSWNNIWNLGNDLESQDISSVPVYCLSAYAPEGEGLFWYKTMNPDGSFNINIW